VITGGMTVGSTRVFGLGMPNVPCGLLKIYHAGSLAVLGVGCTDGAGNFTSSPGIALVRPLRPDDILYAFDAANGVEGPSVAVAPPQPAPPLGSAGLLALLAGLLTIGVRAARRAGRLRRIRR
jgi:hypothetical protein